MRPILILGFAGICVAVNPIDLLEDVLTIDILKLSDLNKTSTPATTRIIAKTTTDRRRGIFAPAAEKSTVSPAATTPARTPTLIPAALTIPTFPAVQITVPPAVSIAAALVAKPQIPPLAPTPLSLVDVRQAFENVLERKCDREQISQTYAEVEKLLKTQAKQCEIKSINKGHCLPYDSSVMATSVEEAIQNFPDLAASTVPTPRGNVVVGGGNHKNSPINNNNNNENKDNKENSYCNTPVCRKCSGNLIDKFSQLDLVSPLNKAILENKFRVGNFRNDSDPQCSRIKSFGSTTSSKTHRFNRDTNALNQDSDFVGVRHNLTCYNRGDSADGNPDFLVLCSTCWVLRVLPTGYYPSFVNEAVCIGDNKCLWIHGVCTERVKQLKVLSNYDVNDITKAKELMISVSSGCDCNVKANSGLKGIVTMLAVP